MRKTNLVTAQAATNQKKFVASSFSSGQFIGATRHLLISAMLICTAPTAMAGAGIWTQADKSPSSINAIAMDPYVPSQIVVSTGAGFGRTADSGNSWEENVHGVSPTAGKIDTLPSFPSANLVRLHNQTNVLFSGTPGLGLYRNFTNATQPFWPSPCGTDTLPTPLPKSWDLVQFTGIATVNKNIANISALATHPSQPLLAVGVTGTGIFVLKNAGSPPTSSIGNCDSTVTPNVYIKSTAYPAESWNSSTGLPSTPTANTLSFDPTQAPGTAIGTTIIYAGMAGQGIYVSVDGGANWGSPTQTVTSGSFTPASFNISAMTTTTQTISSTPTSVIYVGVTGANAGVYKGVVTPGVTPAASSITWTQLNGTLPGLSNVRSLTADPITPTKLYAGTFGYGIYSVNTNSPTWADLSNGLYVTNSNALYVTSLQVDPLNPARIYAGTYGGFFTYEQVSTPIATISPSQLPNFSAINQTQDITLTNTGAAPLTVNNITTKGYFSNANNCPQMLAVNSSCTITVKYSPTYLGTPSSVNDIGSLSISTSDLSSPFITALVAKFGNTSSNGAPALATSPTTLGQFSTSTPLQTIRLTNTGTALLTISDITATGSFTVNSSCPASLNPTISCTLLLQYAPKTTSSETGLLVITSNDPTSPVQIPLNGAPDGSSSSANSISAAPTSLGFIGVPVASMSAVLAVKLTNPTSQIISLNSVQTDNPAFIADWSQCNKQFPANSSCTINVVYIPTNEQSVSANLQIMSSGSPPLSVALTGTSADQTTMTGATYGSANALTLTGNFFFSSREKTSTGNLYIMAYANGQWFSFDGFSWIPWLTGQPRTYGPTATYASKSLTVFNRIDVSQLKGATFFLAYGSKISDVIHNQTFALIYTAP